MKTSKNPETALFLAHEETNANYVRLLARMAGIGTNIIASDNVAAKLSQSIKNVSGFRRYRGNNDEVMSLGLPALPLPEAIMIGVTYPLVDTKIAARLKQKNLPSIDMVVIDPSYSIKMREALASTDGEADTITILNAIAPNLVSVVTAAIKGKRLVICNEEDLGRVVDAIERELFTSAKQEHVEEVAAWTTICNGNSWKLVRDIFSTVSKAFKTKVDIALEKVNTVA